MYKLRFIFHLFSLILSIGFLILIILDEVWFEVYLTIIVINFILNIYFRKAEKKKLMEITFIYINELEPLKYLEEYQKFNKKRFLSRNTKIMDKISTALVLIDAGQINKSYETLFELVDEEEKFNPFIRFWYYKAWIHYFDEVDDLSRMRFLAEQSKFLIQDISPKYRSQILANFELMRARCFIKEGIFLKAAENKYNEVLRGRFPRLTVVNSVYLLGVIAYKKQDYDLSKKRLISVIQNGKELNAAKKAKLLLETIEKIENKV
jgi:hypothetical protein